MDVGPLRRVRGSYRGREEILRAGGSASIAAAASAAVLLGISLAIAPVCAAAAPLAPCPNEALRTGASAGLPDCRAYELVSPKDKGGFDAASRAAALPAQAEPDGEAIAYLDRAAFPGSAGSTPEFDAHLSTRGEDGWTTTELTPPKTNPGPPGAYTLEYAFAEDLGSSIVDSPLQELASGATPGMYNLFLRSGSGEYSLVDTLPPLVAPPGSCSANLEPDCYQFTDVNVFAGASRDFQYILFESTAQYEAGAPEPPSLYESSLEDGQRMVRLVGYLPNGEAATGGSTAGGGLSTVVGSYVEDGRVANAISADGSHVVFEAAANGGEAYEAGQVGLTEVYDRVNHEDTVELSAPSEGATPSDRTAQPARFWAASSDGSRVFFTSEAELTSESNTGEDKGEDLYEYDLEAQSGEAALRDLSVDRSEAAGARVLGVAGASEDGEYVYFVAEGVLAAGAQAGKPNLYLVRRGQAPLLVATLSPKDARDWTSTPAAEGEPEEGEPEEEPHPVGPLESYVAPNGQHFAFMSLAPLTTANYGADYNNRDRATGEPDAEVYEFIAPGAGAGTGVLDCASCGASEGAPSGEALLGGVAETGSSGTSFRQARALSEDGGRLFFTAPDASGGRGVYEYEHNGEGSCTLVQGCTFALSEPPDGTQDHFLDASTNGDDVFFTTASQLVPGDDDELEDVYDARVDGGFAEGGETSCESGCRAAGPSAIESPAITSSSVGPSSNVPPRTSAAGVHRPTKKKHKRRRRRRSARGAKRHAKQRKRRDKKRTRSRSRALEAPRRQSAADANESRKRRQRRVVEHWRASP